MNFQNNGYCNICEKETIFSADNEWLRDHYKCQNCQSIPRERAIIYVLNILYPKWQNLYIHESSPAERGASWLLNKKCKNYTASQYYPKAKPAEIINSYRNENL